MTELVSAVAFCGADWKAASALRRAVIDFSAITTSLSSGARCDSNVFDESNNFTTEGADVRFELATKYYDVSLSLRTIALSSEEETTTSSGAIGDNVVEAVVAVISKEEQFNESLKARFSIFDESGSPDLSLRLLVSINNENAMLNDEDRTERVMWCIDHGFEHIEIDGTSVASFMSTWDAREKEGLPRLMEALGSNMWRNIRRRESSSTSAVKRTAQTDVDEASSCSASSTTETVDTSHSRISVSSSATPPIPGNSSTLFSRAEVKSTESFSGGSTTITSSASGAEKGVDSLPNPPPRGASATAEIETTVQIATNSSTSKNEEGDEKNKGKADKKDGDNSVNDDLDDETFCKLEDIMSRAKQYRDEALSGKVTDEERRNRAEMVANALASMLNLGDDDSDDNSD